MTGQPRKPKNMGDPAKVHSGYIYIYNVGTTFSIMLAHRLSITDQRHVTFHAAIENVCLRTIKEHWADEKLIVYLGT